MKTKEPLKERYSEMTNEEYRAELRSMLDEAEDNNLLHDFHTYATQRISGRAVDYHVSNPDYGGMVIEMVGKIEDERLLKYFCTYISEILHNLSMD